MTSTLLFFLFPAVSVSVSASTGHSHFVFGMSTRFIELGSILEPGRTPKTDKAAILVDAVRMVTQLRGEAQKLRDSNSSLQEKIKELKVFWHLCASNSFFFLMDLWALVIYSRI